MQWIVRQGEQKYIIDLPARLGDSRAFIATINGREVEAEWDARMGLLSVTVDRKTHNLKLRNYSQERFPDESETTVKLEWFDGLSAVMRNSELVMDHHVPGSANRRAAAASAGKQIRSPMTGKILSVAVSNNEAVSKGQTLMVIEAMKMENKIAATASGVVQGLQVTSGQSVTVGTELCSIQPEAPS